MLISPLAGALSDKIGRRPIMVTGLTLQALGFAWVAARGSLHTSWVELVLGEKYCPRRRQLPAGQLRDFAARHFGEQGGYAQQYLFHHARKTTPRRLSPRAR